MPDAVASVGWGWGAYGCSSKCCDCECDGDDDSTCDFHWALLVSCWQHLNGGASHREFADSWDACGTVQNCLLRSALGRSGRRLEKIISAIERLGFVGGSRPVIEHRNSARRTEGQPRRRRHQGGNRTGAPRNRHNVEPAVDWLEGNERRKRNSRKCFRQNGLRRWTRVNPLRGSENNETGNEVCIGTGGT